MNGSEFVLKDFRDLPKTLRRELLGLPKRALLNEFDQTPCKVVFHGKKVVATVKFGTGGHIMWIFGVPSQIFFKRVKERFGEGHTLGEEMLLGVAHVTGNNTLTFDELHPQAQRMFKRLENKGKVTRLGNAIRIRKKLPPFLEWEL